MEGFAQHYGVRAQTIKDYIGRFQFRRRGALVRGDPPRTFMLWHHPDFVRGCDASQIELRGTYSQSPSAALGGGGYAGMSLGRTRSNGARGGGSYAFAAGGADAMEVQYGSFGGHALVRENSSSGGRGGSGGGDGFVCVKQESQGVALNGAGGGGGGGGSGSSGGCGGSGGSTGIPSENNEVEAFVLEQLAHAVRAQVARSGFRRADAAAKRRAAANGIAAIANIAAQMGERVRAHPVATPDAAAALRALTVSLARQLGQVEAALSAWCALSGGANALVARLQGAVAQGVESGAREEKGAGGGGGGGGGIGRTGGGSGDSGGDSGIGSSGGGSGDGGGDSGIGSSGGGGGGGDSGGGGGGGDGSSGGSGSGDGREPNPICSGVSSPRSPHTPGKRPRSDGGSGSGDEGGAAKRAATSPSKTPTPSAVTAVGGGGVGVPAAPRAPPDAATAAAAAAATASATAAAAASAAAATDAAAAAAATIAAAAIAAAAPAFAAAPVASAAPVSAAMPPIKAAAAPAVTSRHIEEV
ncbi:hypothetical protein JKP88DRAFT_350151 [Tribonema minus]|uniref:Uncharacterized protein n=1 Tax=Tribonema minus TaxID=303371 RepID=A0A836CBF2_9STRA|nr:hypothetical protein JKP88DRAFT_350151 [Tribonema minus]